MIEESTIADLHTALQTNAVTSRQLVQYYLERIEALDRAGPQLRAVIEINPEAPAIAEALDDELERTGARGPLHGIPILIKDNIDTADQLHTTAGSFALLGTRPAQDAAVVKQLRDAGAVVLGKANLSEWANFRSFHASSGWSARGGQCLNPYDLERNPCGSSSGSAVAVAANLASVALGTETTGSIVCAAHANGVVGIKPTVGLCSRAGVIPIAHSQDTVGPLARSVADAAAVLGALAASDERDAATLVAGRRVYSDYGQFLQHDGLRGARIGVPRKVYFGYSAEADAIANAAIETMRSLGATIVDPADIPTAELLNTDTSSFDVLLYEFKAGLEAYLGSRVPDERYPAAAAPRTLQALIDYNLAHAQQEMPFWEQEIFLLAQAKGPLSELLYTEALASTRRMAREQGIDAVMHEHRLDALVAPTAGPAWPIDLQHGDHVAGSSWGPAGIAGYPLLTVPAGFARALPLGITFMGGAWSEPTLIKLAYAFEQASKARRPPALPRRS